MKRNLARVFILLLCFSFSAGIAFTQSKGKIGYLPQSSFASTYSVACYYGTTDTIKELGYEPIVRNADFNASKQIEMMEDFIAEGEVKGIILHAIDIVLSIKAVEKANAAGIPVVAVISAPQGGKLLCSVQMSNQEQARLAAEVIVKELTKKYGSPKGKVYELHGGYQDDVAKGRSEGYNEYMKKYPNIKTITKLASNWSLQLAEQVTRDAFTANPDFDAIFAASDWFNDSLIAGLGGKAKLKKIGQPGHIIWATIDGLPQSFPLIRDGYMDHNSNVEPFYIHQLAVKYLAEFLEKGTLPKVGTVITEKDATWSPAKIVAGPNGPEIILTPFSINAKTVDNPNLWGGKKWEKRAGD